MCCFVYLDKYRCNAGGKKTVVADLFGDKLRSFTRGGQVPMGTVVLGLSPKLDFFL